MNKTPGQIAYEQEVEMYPLYHNGEPRQPWEKLCKLAHMSWERYPTPRTFKTDAYKGDR